MKKGAQTAAFPGPDEMSGIRQRLSELEETLLAIRTGAVDALVVEGPFGEQVFTLRGAEQAYRVLVEAMNEGAVTLDRAGIILYCNNRFATMIATPLEKVLGAPFTHFLAPREEPAFKKFLRRTVWAKNTMETTLASAGGFELSVHLSANSLALEEARGVCLVITDISQRKAMEEARRNLARSVIQAQERERKRVALDLHDGINQLLASTKHRMHSIERKLNGHSGSLREEVVAARELLDRTMREVRLISRNLRPSELDDLGLLPALRSLCADFETRSGISVKLAARATPRNGIPGEVELTIYRILQEGLANVARHSGASSVSIRLSRSKHHVQLVIQDNGCGFVPSEVGSNQFGLANMRERASHVNGRFEIQTVLKSGTTIRLRIAIEKQSHAQL
jgi:PAS domain S-box-containing protein